MPIPLFALFLAAFAVGTTEFVIAGLLPALAGDLQVDIPTAGLLITGYAAGVAIGGPVLAVFTGRLPRKPLMLGLMILFVAGNVLCALATSYWLLMGARLVISCSHGLFFGVAMIIATGLVAPERQASAVSLVIAGITVANVLGAPGGTAIGNAFGWRATFWVIAGLGVVVTAALAVLVPAIPRAAHRAGGVAAEVRAVSRPAVLLSYLMIVMMMTAIFTVLTFIAPILTEVTGMSSDAVPWVLFASGAGGIVGNLVGGRLGDWRPMPALIVIFAIEVLFYAVLLVAQYYPLWMTATVFASSVVGFAFAAPVQSRILRRTADAPNLASTLISTAFNIGIAIGAWLGGFALSHGWAYADLPRIAVLSIAGALAVAIVTWALERRETRAGVAAG